MIFKYKKTYFNNVGESYDKFHCVEVEKINEVEHTLQPDQYETIVRSNKEGSVIVTSDYHLMDRILIKMGRGRLSTYKIQRIDVNNGIPVSLSVKTTSNVVTLRNR